LAVLQGARRENIPCGSLTDEQRRSSGKDRQPGGLFSGGHLAALLLSHRAFGHAPSSRLASRPPENSAPIPYFVTGSKSPATRPFLILIWAHKCKGALAGASANLNL
jgi:hypothetical protein